MPKQVPVPEATTKHTFTISEYNATPNNQISSIKVQLFQSKSNNLLLNIKSIFAISKRTFDAIKITSVEKKANFRRQ